MSPRTAAVLDPDLEAGLKRLKLAAVRRLAPEVLQTAKVQRWAPDELLRTLVEAEIAARDASNEVARRKAAGFPVTRRLEDFVLPESSVPRTTFEHLASLDWIDAAENVVLVGPAGTGKSHLLLGIGEAAVVAGRRVRYLPAASLVETLYGGLADNSVGRVIERLLRADLVIIDDLGFAPLDDVGS
jgi:DNA replication protein DnaC